MNESLHGTNKCKVLVTGPESSGTLVVSRILEQAGADVMHQSATYLPGLRDFAKDSDYVIAIFRDPIVTMGSQSWHAEPFEKLQRGYNEIFLALANISATIYVITYEQLILNPKSINPLLERMGLQPSEVTEKVENRNEKYYSTSTGKVDFYSTCKT